MQKKFTRIIGFTILGIVLITVMLLAIFQDRIPSNPTGTMGNTTGNLYNKGKFCESNGEVFFSNAYDSGNLYAMNLDESNIRKIAHAKSEYINAAGDYIYYYQVDASGAGGLGFIRRANGVFRITKKGDKVTCLSQTPATNLILADDTLYFQNYDTKTNFTLYRMNTDRSDKKQLRNETINPIALQNNIIYYISETENLSLFSLNTQTGISTQVSEIKMWNPIAIGEYIFYMDVSNNYRLNRYSLSDGTNVVLTEDRIETYNVFQDRIYYQTNEQSAPALKRMYIDGSSHEIIAEGSYENINITSSYVYFNLFGETTPIYRMPLNGGLEITEFSAAKQAALSQGK